MAVIYVTKPHNATIIKRQVGGNNKQLSVNRQFMSRANKQIA